MTTQPLSPLTMLLSRHTRRREFIRLLGGAVVTWPREVTAQQTGKVYRIGILETISPALNAANFDALRKALQALGYVEGQGLVFEYRSADGRNERFPDLAAELVRLKVDLIVTRSTPAVLAVKAATSTIPVIMAATANPVGDGVVMDIARPGGNITGLSSFHTELSPKRVELLRELIPGIAKIATITDPTNPVSAGQQEDMRTAARSFGIEALFLDVRNREDIGPSFEAAVKKRVDALIVQNGAPTQANLQLTVDLAARHRLPAIYASREFVDVGGLMTYGVSYPDLYRRAAAYVDKILRGARPADLPIQQPTKLELVINLKTAKALGLTISESFLLRADEVIA